MRLRRHAFFLSGGRVKIT